MEVDHRGGEAAVAQELADHHQIDTRLQEPRCVRMTHGVGRDMLVDLGLSRCQGTSFLNHCLVEWRIVGLAREEVIARALIPPVTPQFGQKPW